MQIPCAQPRWLVVSLAACALIALTMSGGAVSSTNQAGGVGEITVLSNRADLISGGDALVSVDLRANPEPSPSRSTATMSPTRSPSGRTVASKAS